MAERTRACRVFVAVGVALSVVLLVFTVVGHVWNVCYVAPNGYSLYAGKGYVEYGYGWGWIRRRMFHDGRVEKGWQLRRTLPALAGTVPVDIPPSIQVPVWFCTVISIGATYALRRRGRLWDLPEPRTVIAVLIWTLFELVVIVALDFVYSLSPRSTLGHQMYLPDESELLVSFVVAATTILIPVWFLKDWDRNRVVFRRRHRLCIGCRYNLTGNVSGRCPECGMVIREFKGSGDHRPSDSYRA